MTNKKPQKLGLEKTLAELETLVEKMESGELSLEDSLQLFEKGIMLTKICQKTLSNAEQKVKQLTQDKGQYELAKYQEEE